MGKKSSVRRRRKQNASHATTETKPSSSKWHVKETLGLVTAVIALVAGGLKLASDRAEHPQAAPTDTARPADTPAAPQSSRNALEIFPAAVSNQDPRETMWHIRNRTGSEIQFPAITCKMEPVNAVHIEPSTRHERRRFQD
jgi:hypothetical protein